MHLPPVLVASPDDEWRADVADCLIVDDLMVYCAKGVDEATCFLKAGVEPLLLVLDGRQPVDVDRYVEELRRDVALRRFPVVVVCDGGRQCAAVDAFEMSWILVERSRLEQTVQDLIASTARIGR